MMKFKLAVILLTTFMLSSFSAFAEITPAIEKEPIFSSTLLDKEPMRTAETGIPVSELNQILAGTSGCTDTDTIPCGVASDGISRVASNWPPVLTGLACNSYHSVGASIPLRPG